MADEGERVSTFPLFIWVFLFFLPSLLPAGAWALDVQEAGKPIKALSAHAASMDTVWTLIASFLIFLMQAGFTLVEVGFTRAKNAGNVVMKNMIDFALGSIGASIQRVGPTLQEYPRGGPDVGCGEDPN